MADPTPTGIAARSAVVGRFAKIQLNTGFGAADVVLLFDWEVNVNFDYADATAHGDRWKVKAFIDADWTARARGYVVPVDTNTYIKNATNSSGPILINFIGYTDMTATTVVWTGTGYIQRGRISAPLALMEQEFELVSSGAVTAGTFF